MTAPGWYPDGNGATRWFDGTAWTENVALVGSQGAYALQGELGQGAFGTVYLATHPVSGQQVAIKVFNNPDAQARADLAREASALVAVRHGNCLQIMDVIDSGGTLALVTDFVPGATLRAMLDQHGALSGPQALQVLWGAGHGLAAVHAAGLVHGDVKPANMLVQPDGVSKLIDFGLVGVPGLSSPDGSVSGSPAYAAPEQMLRGARTPPSDIYALSVTLYEVLAGQRPYRAASVESMALAHAQEAVPDLRLVRPEVGPLLAALVGDGMAKDPAARPQNMTAWLRRFQDAATETYGAGWLAVGGLGAIAGGAAGAGLISLASGVTVAASGSAAAVTAAASGVAAGGVAGGIGSAAAVGASTTVSAGAAGASYVPAMGLGAKLAVIGFTALAAVGTTAGAVGLAMNPATKPPQHSQPSGSPSNAQPVAATASAPTNIVLLIDTSGSMADPALAGTTVGSGGSCPVDQDQSIGDGSKLCSAVQASLALVDMIKGQDTSQIGTTNVGVVNFSDSATTDVPLGTDCQASETALSQFATGSGTNMTEGVTAALQALQGATGTKTIIFMTDGVPTDSTTASDVVTAATAAGVTVDTVGFGDPSQTGDAGVDTQLLQDVASGTGGIYSFADSGSLLRQAFWKARYNSIGSVLASDTGQLSQGNSSTPQTATVADGSGTLQVALAWPGSTMNVHLVDPGGQTIDNGVAGATVTSTGNQEFVTVPNPAAGTWSVSVDATVTNGAEDYGIVAATYGYHPRGTPMWATAALWGGIGLFVLIACFGFWRFLRRLAR